MGKAQPDNYNGEKAGRQHNQHHIHVDKLVLVSRLDGVKDKSGLTVEGLQEYYDEACLAVLNNFYADGIRFHDVSCHHKKPVICQA